ncbi:MAG: hypothetical protein JWM12_4324, partial [Ilumatobacteraceae bacterium]|nr:hypothetical protein [Ilumatobacteraceae bacterium]
PSRHEPIGLVFVEAAQHGLATIGTEVGGIPEAIVAGETGLLVRPDNPQELADAIVRFVNDPDLRSRLGDAGRRRARETFSEVMTVDGYVRAYNEVLDPPSRGTHLDRAFYAVGRPLAVLACLAGAQKACLLPQRAPTRVAGIDQTGHHAETP